MSEVATAKAGLIRLLRAAHAGERAAALAYAGHARSVRAVQERIDIARIGAEEVAHRARVGAMLNELGGAPSVLRELIFTGIGRTLSVFCHVTGWYCPMYGAGWIERRNLQEYVDAAAFAARAGRADLADELLEMARIEWDHEQYFRAKVLSHPLRHLLRVWQEPPPRGQLGQPQPLAQAADSC
ncbi:MAG TPA: demethoxyubiquinone hydroxylase family protein [Planctomycetota bacterium]|nr:demethoxyubiquinone hydroxylase family protein [Planctomycetota bacterium]